jgi:hypothetical protein
VTLAGNPSSCSTRAMPPMPARAILRPMRRNSRR